MTREPEEADLRRKIGANDVTISRETLLARPPAPRRRAIRSSPATSAAPRS